MEGPAGPSTTLPIVAYHRRPPASGATLTDRAVVLLDLDHTLFDSDASEAAAFAHALSTIGVEADSAMLDRYRAINRAMWRRVEAGTLSVAALREQRFESFLEAERIDVSTPALADAFVDGLGGFGELYPGVRAVLDELNELATLALVTNGIGQVQRHRIRRLSLERRFAVVVVSGEVGVAKPDPAIFQIVVDRLGSPPKDRMIMVGDSLTSDIAGGRAFGIDTVWLDRDAEGSGDQTAATHRIRSLTELPAIVSRL